MGWCKMDELVSVVISTYKRDFELKRALTSVMNQTYSNIEIVVVDDNGQNTIYQKKVEKIINSFREKINIKYIINKNNLGGALSRNIGIENCSGKYVGFLDDDDEYYPEKIEKQLKLFKDEKNPKLALVYSYCDSFDECGKKLMEYRNNLIGNCLAESMYDCIASTSLWLCKKEYLENVEGFSDVPSKQDSTVIIKLLSKGYEVNRVPEVLVKYNEHNNIRISGKTIRNIQGEEKLRDYCRTLYGNLASSEIITVESSFSYRLCKLYAYNNLKEKLKKESIALKKTNIINYLKIIGYYYWINCKMRFN